VELHMGTEVAALEGDEVTDLTAAMLFAFWPT
jgi:hypothetical protein